MNKILKKISLITLLLITIYITKQSVVYGVGLVYQAWADDSSKLYFRTFTAPHTSTLKAYAGYNKTDPANNSTGKTLDTVMDGWFYNSEDKSTAGRTSKWVYSEKEQELKNDKPDWESFSTRKLIFHTKMTSNYMDGGNYKYTIVNTATTTDLSSIKNICGSAGASGNVKFPTNTTSPNDYASSVITDATITESADYTSLYRMTLIAVSTGKTDSPVYVADRVLESSTINLIKGKNIEYKGTTYQNSIFVSQSLGYTNVKPAPSSWGNDNVIKADTPSMFIKHEQSPYNYDWGASTHGQKTDALGSALNLYDNILRLPTGISRSIIVKHINIGTDQTVTKNNRGDLRDTDNFNTKEVQDCNKKSGCGTYLGYNIAKGDTSEIAKKNIEAVINTEANGISKTEDKCTVEAYNGKKDQYVIVEMYYNDKSEKPPEGKSITVMARRIAYDSDGNILGVIQEENDKTAILTSGKNKTFNYVEKISLSKSTTATYSGKYIISKDDSTMPEAKIYDTNGIAGNECSITYDDSYKDGQIVYINFKYEAPAPPVERTVNYRYVFYSATGEVKGTELATKTVESNSTTKVEYKGNTCDYNGDNYSYVGFVALYDKSMPSCYAYATGSSYQIDGSTYREGTWINFMYKLNGENINELDDPTRIGSGYLSIKELTTSIHKMADHNSDRINNEVSIVKKASILSVPSGEAINFGMKDLNKYYLAATHVDSTIKESIEGDWKDIFNWFKQERRHATFSVIHVILIVLKDVNTGTLRVSPYYDTYNYIIPYKYIQYSLGDYAVYKLKGSVINTPDGTNENQTLGEKVLDDAVYNVLDYGVNTGTDNVNMKTEETGIDKIAVLKFEGDQATFKIDSGFTTSTDFSNLIKRITTDEEGNKVEEPYSEINASSIVSFAIGGNVSNTITSLLNSAEGDAVGVINKALNGTGTADAAIIEIVPAYTNISTDWKSAIKALLTGIECTSSIFMQALSLFGISIPTELDCADVPKGFQETIEFIKSWKKSAVYVYKAKDKSNNNQYYVKNVASTYAPNTTIRRQLDSLRTIEKTFTLGTTSKNSKIVLNCNGLSDPIVVAETSSLETTITSALRNIMETWGNTLFEMFGVSDYVSISQKKISDLNFSEKDGNVLSDIFNWFEDKLGTPRTFSYIFNGYVCVYDASSGMRVTTAGKSAYKDGFGGTIDSFTIGKHFQESIDIKRLNGIRALAENTTYESDVLTGDTKSIEDNIFWSYLNVLGEKNIFKYTEDLDKYLKYNHNVYNEKADAINVYTPIELNLSDPHSSDDKLISQIIETTSLPPIFNINQFYFYVSPKNYSGGVYGNLTENQINTYIKKYVIELTFDAEKVTYKGGDMPNVTAGTLIEIDNDPSYYEPGTNEIKISVKAKEELIGAQLLSVKAIARNMTSTFEKESDKLTYEEFLEARGNICNNILKDITLIDGPAYYDKETKTLESDTVDRLYDFRVTDVKDIDWKGIFRAGSSHSGIAYYTGLRKYDLASGMLKRTKNQVGDSLNRTLPIGPYKSTDSTYVKAPKLGYRISFDIKLSGKYSTNSDPTGPSGNFIRDINITPRFYYIGKNGTGYNKDIDLYYKNSDNKYIKVGSASDNYKLTFIPKDGLRLLSEEDEDNHLVTSVENLGGLTNLVLKPDKMTTGYTGGNYQTYYGEYKLPNSTIVVNKDAIPSEANRLKDGYVGVIFEIRSKYKYGATSTIYNLSYGQDMDKETTSVNNSSQWEFEGYLKQKYNEAFTSAKIQLEKGIWSITNDAQYNEIKGTVVLFDLDARASTDFE